MKVRDLEEDFDALLDDAEDNAVSTWEMDFVSDMQERYDKFEGDTFISDKQLNALKKIAGW